MEYYTKEGIPIPAIDINEKVNHPYHYQTESGLEAIDIIEAFNLDFLIGNCIKYLLRAGKKDSEIQDYKKALWYLNRKIEKLKNV